MAFDRTVWNLWNPTIARFNYILRSGGRLSLGLKYVTDEAARARLARFAPDQAAFRTRSAAELVRSRDYFTVNIPAWLDLFERFLDREDALNILEIGAFEGVSSHFILSHFPNARLISVDPWTGSDEHVGDSEIDKIEEKFDANVARYAGRLNKYKGFSREFFADPRHQDRVFDFIYVDGSHRASDVMIDAVFGWERLKAGGVMIFDDFFWRFYGDEQNNPCVAVCAFIRLKRREMEVVRVGRQVQLRKTPLASA